MAYFFAISVTGTLSVSRRSRTICSSLNVLLRIAPFPSSPSPRRDVDVMN